MLGAAMIFLATSAGAMVALFFRKLDEKGSAIMLSFAAGVMAYTSVEMLKQTHDTAGDVVVLLGFAAGVALLIVAERLLPHVHRHIRKKELADEKKKAVMVGGSIALHNIPEGFAVATAFAASTPLGWVLTTSIALQDVPEGALVSAPLATYGMDKWKSVLFGVLSGLVEAIAAIAGYVFLGFFTGLVPAALAFSAGAMAYVVFVELLPDAMKNGKEQLATVGFLGGAAIAFVIASLLTV